MTTFKPGDLVECSLTTDEQNTLRERDAGKAKKEGQNFFMGKAAAYMHTDEAYVVVSITKTGGLRLRGFVPTVSPNDVRPSTQPTYR
jgi:hypothetical protein